MNNLEQVLRKTRFPVWGVVLLLFALIPSRAATLVWDPNTETNLLGYNVYISPTGLAPTVVDVGNHTNYPLAGLAEGVTYTFYVTAYNTDLIESDPSQSVTYTVPFAPPVITNQPAGLTVGPGAPLSLSVGASGNGGRTYQWFKNGLAIAGATNSSFIIASGAISDSGTYTVRVTNPGGSVTSQPAELTVQVGGAIPPPVISRQPQAIAARQGDPAQLSVEVLGGGGTLTYQWWKNGRILFGAFGPVVNFPSISPADAGTYFVILKNATGQTISETVTVDVLAAPTIVASPVKSDVGVDSTAILSVEVTGPGPFTYQWMRNGTNIPRATESVFVIPAAQVTDSGMYSVAVSNPGGTTITDPVPLTVYLAPVITKDPQNTSVPFGGTATLHVEVDGTSPMTFQWFKDFLPVPNGTNADLIISDAQYTDSGAYFVSVSNPAGLASSASATLAVGGPQIVASPSSTVVSENGAATLNVQVTGEAPFSYQWFKDGAPLTGQTNSSLSLSGAKATDEGDYWVVVANRRGSATSGKGHIAVLAPPSILVQQPPPALDVKLGFPLNLSVDVKGTPPLFCQWMKDGANLPGATGMTLTLPEVTMTAGGRYSVSVRNPYGAVTSVVAEVNVVGVPRIVFGPASLTTRVGLPVSLRVSATSEGSRTYQWLKDGQPIPGATNDSLFIPAAQPGDAGEYLVVVANAAGSVTSNPATVTVLQPPVILVQPASQTINEGADLNLTVEAAGSLPLSYQWLKDGVALPGQVSAALHIPNLLPEMQGDYSVRITNPAGTVVSSNASITVVARPAKPALQINPNRREFLTGEFVTMYAVVSGTALEYQWFKDGSPVPGATRNVLTLPGITTNDFGAYKLRVLNVAGFTDSEELVLSPLLPPSITLQPVGASILPGQPFALTVEPTGSGPLAIQWQKNGVDIPGATSNTLIVASAALQDAGEYRVRISNSMGYVISDSVRVTVLQPVRITTQPAGTNAFQGSAVVLSVEAEGTPPVTYQWFKDEWPLPGATNSVLVLANVTAADSASYSVVVANGFGSETSAAAVVTVQHAETDEALGRLAVTPSSVNSVQFLARGLPGHTYDVQATADFAAGNWTTFQTVVVDASGTFTIIPGDLSTNRALFFRTVRRDP